MYSDSGHYVPVYVGLYYYLCKAASPTLGSEPELTYLSPDSVGGYLSLDLQALLFDEAFIDTPHPVTSYICENFLASDSLVNRRPTSRVI